MKVFRAGAARGFTLIELLIVITIMSLLAGMLLPVFARAREKARQASCQSNLKQIGIAIMMYVSDYDQTLPDPNPNFYAGSGCPNNESGTGGCTGREYSWQAVLLPYIKTDKIYVCPSSPFRPTGDNANTCIGAVDPSANCNGTGYAYNGSYWGAAPKPDGSSACSECNPPATCPRGPGGYRTIDADVKDPAGTILVGDSPPNGRYVMGDMASCADMTTCAGGDPFIQGTYDGQAYPQLRHNGGFNLLYADGHVKWNRTRLPCRAWTIDAD